MVIAAVVLSVNLRKICNVSEFERLRCLFLQRFIKRNRMVAAADYDNLVLGANSDLNLITRIATY